MKHDYHDATLKVISIDWAARSARFEFAICAEKPTTVRMIMTGLQSLCCPHESPWGESSSVNAIRVTGGVDRGSTLEVEMQSGDAIWAKGQEVIENGYG